MQGPSFRLLLIEKLLVPVQEHVYFLVNCTFASQPHTAFSVQEVNKKQGTREHTAVKECCEFEKLLSGAGQ